MFIIKKLIILIIGYTNNIYHFLTLTHNYINIMHHIISITTYTIIDSQSLYK